MWSLFQWTSSTVLFLCGYKLVITLSEQNIEPPIKHDWRGEGGGVGDIFSILLSISAHSDDTFSGIYFRDGGETEWGPTKLKEKTSKDDEKGKYLARRHGRLLATLLTLRLSSAKVCFDLTPGLHVRWITWKRTIRNTLSRHLLIKRSLGVPNTK